jgi:hypothetical protein
MEDSLKESLQLDIDVFNSLKEQKTDIDERFAMFKESIESKLSKIENNTFLFNSQKLYLYRHVNSYDFSHISEIVEMEKNLKDLKEKYKQAYWNEIENNEKCTDEGEVLESAAIPVYTRPYLRIKNG